MLDGELSGHGSAGNMADPSSAPLSDMKKISVLSYCPLTFRCWISRPMCAYQDKVVFIDQVAGTHRLTAVSAIGVSFPLHCSANGKALLAALGDEDIGKRKRRIRLSANTPNSITTWDRLDREIAAIRKQ